MSDLQSLVRDRTGSSVLVEVVVMVALVVVVVVVVVVAVVVSTKPLSSPNPTTVVSNTSNCLKLQTLHPKPPK